jgi:hypothetical protein
LDDWAEITRGLFSEDQSGDPAAIVFFMIFILVVTYTLFPVIVAVILDKFSQVRAPRAL